MKGNNTIKIKIDNSYITVFISPPTDGIIDISCDNGNGFSMFTNMKEQDLTNDDSICYYNQLKENLGGRSRTWAAKKAFLAHVVPSMIKSFNDSPILSCLIESVLLNTTCRGNQFNLPKNSEFTITDTEITYNNLSIARPKSMSEISEWEHNNTLNRLFNL